MEKYLYYVLQFFVIATVPVSSLKHVEARPPSTVWAVGAKCLATWTDGNTYPAIIDSIEGDTAHVTFPEYGETGSAKKQQRGKG